MEFAGKAGLSEAVCLQGILCDVILVVQGKHILAHRVVLAAASHFFNLMFTCEKHFSMHLTHVSSYTQTLVKQLLLLLHVQRV